MHPWLDELYVRFWDFSAGRRICVTGSCVNTELELAACVSGLLTDPEFGPNVAILWKRHFDLLPGELDSELTIPNDLFE